MATGYELLGTRLLDVLSRNSNEVASFGNESSDAFVRFYDNNAPTSTGYLMGLSNSSFFVVKGSDAQDTHVGIGTANPNPAASLTVQGTLMTSNIAPYEGTDIFLGNNNLVDVGDLYFTGRIFEDGKPFITTQWTTCNETIYFTSNVGIGTISPDNALTVLGDVYISGTLSAADVFDISTEKAVFATYKLFDATNDTKTLITNDPDPYTRVLFEFTTSPGKYFIMASIPYKNMTAVQSLDTTNWASIGLYGCSAIDYDDTKPAVHLVQLTGIGGDDQYDCVHLQVFHVVKEQNGQTFTVAIKGKGHELQIGGANSPTVALYVVPMSGLGQDDYVDIRQALQVYPTRHTETTTASKSEFTLSYDGAFTVQTSNVEVFVNGLKKKETDFALTTNFVAESNATFFTVNMNTPVTSNSYVDISVWPQADGYEYHSSGYLYQSITNISTPWLNVVGGGVRTADRLVVDGDLFVQGNIYGGCNTTLFSSGLLWTNDLNQISSNIIGSANLIDGSIETSKIQDGAVTTAKLAAGSVSADKIASLSISTSQIANDSITTDKLSFRTSNVGIGTVPRARLDVNGSVRTNVGYTIGNSNALVTTDFNQNVFGSSFAFAGSNTQLASTYTPIIQLESRTISQANSTTLASWNGFTQATAGYQPVYYNTGGYLQGAFVRFDSANLRNMTLSSRTFSMSTNAGFTASALIKFDTGATGTIGDRVFHLQVGVGTTFITMGRSSTGNSLEFSVNNGTTANTLTIPNVIDSEWAVYTVTMSAVTNGYITVYKNGSVIGTKNTTFNLSNTVFSNIAIGKDGGNTNFGNVSLAGLYLYDRLLPMEHLQSVMTYLQQGSSCVQAPLQHVMSVHPITMNGDLPRQPMYTLRTNAQLRVHALPGDALFMVDANMPSTSFANSANQPTFNTSSSAIQFTKASSHFLNLGSRYYPIGTQGFTFLCQFRFTGTNASNNERILDINNGTTGTNHILVQRVGTTQNLRFSVANLSGTTASVTSSFQFLQDTTYTLAVRFDRDNRGTMTFWINGQLDATVTSIGSGAIGPVQDRAMVNTFLGRPFSTASAEYFSGTIYQAVAYNRALTEDEIRMSHVVMTSDSQRTVADIASRTGKPALSVTREGNVVPFSVNTDTISGLQVFLPFDHHLHETVNNNVVGAPTTVGTLQFNTRGKYGSSLILQNTSSLVSQYVEYPLQTSLGSNVTIAFWLRPYQQLSRSHLFTLTSTDYSGWAYIYGLMTTTGIGYGMQRASADFIGDQIFSTTLQNTWYHYALTISGGTLSLYLNGALVQTASITASSTAVRHLLTIGAYNNQGTATNGYNGEFQHFRLYNRALTAQEVAQIANMPDDTYALKYKTIGNTNDVIRMTNGGMMVNGGFQLSPTSTLESVTTSVPTQTNTLSYTTADYQLSDFTGTTSNLTNYIYGTVTSSNVGPFGDIPTEGSFNLPGAIGSYISITNSAFNFNWWQNSGFTVEAWVNYRNFTNAARSDYNAPALIGTMSPSGTANDWSFGATSGGRVAFYYWNGSPTAVQGSTTLATDTWYHIAATCDTTTIRVFVNGTLDGSAAIVGTPNTPTTALTIGNFNTSSGTSTSRGQVNALVSNLRLVRGAALYLTSFTAPTAPLVQASSGTTLLDFRVSQTLRTPMQLSHVGNMTLAGNISAGNVGMFRNRVINGDMRVDQRFNGSTVTIAANGSTSSYSNLIDRFSIYRATNAGLSIAQIAVNDHPTHTNALQVAITTADASPNCCEVRHTMEGLNIADFRWGTPFAQSVALGFWVKSSVTGSYACSIRNGWNGTTDRFYLIPYTIVQANVWEYKSFIIPGETTSTNWRTNNTGGLDIIFDLGSSVNVATSANIWTTTNSKKLSTTLQFVSQTAGATWAVTGIQLEKGTIATPFELRPYATELQLCQRYCMRLGGRDSYDFFGSGVAISTTSYGVMVPLPVSMRAPNASTISTTTVSNFAIQSTTTMAASAIVKDRHSTNNIKLSVTVSGATAGYGGNLMDNSGTGAGIILIENDF